MFGVSILLQVRNVELDLTSNLFFINLLLLFALYCSNIYVCTIECGLFGFFSVYISERVRIQSISSYLLPGMIIHIRHSRIKGGDCQKLKLSGTRTPVCFARQQPCRMSTEHVGFVLPSLYLAGTACYVRLL